MEKFVTAITGAVTIAGAVLFLFGDPFDEKKKPLDLPPVPPLSAVAEARIVCTTCADPAEPTVLEQDGVSVQVSAESTVPADPAAGAPKTAKVKVKVQTKKPATVVPAKPYIVLRPENGADYSLPPTDYRFATASGDSIRRPQRAVRPVESIKSATAEDWPLAEDTVESELEFEVNVDILSGRFSVKLPDILVDGKSYAVPSVTFEQRVP